MNKEIFKGSWNKMKGELKQKWADLTDDELLRIEGNHDGVYGILEKKYGHAKDEAKKMINSF